MRVSIVLSGGFAPACDAPSNVADAAGTYMMHTGYRSELGTRHPEIGAVLAKYLYAHAGVLPPGGGGPAGVGRPRAVPRQGGGTERGRVVAGAV